MSLPVLPAIVFEEGQVFQVVTSVGSEKANWLGVKHARKSPTFVYDSNGVRWWAVLDAPEQHFSLLARILNLSRTLPQSYECMGEMPVHDMIKTLCDIIDNDPDDLWDQWMSHKQLKTRFRKLHTPAELIQFAGDLGSAEFHANLGL